MATPEQKLKRYLHFGKETPFFQPGDRATNAAYHPTELSCIEALIASEKSAEAVNLIVKAFSDGYSPFPETVVCALAYCARQKTSQSLREAAYNAVKTVCATTENLFLFIKHCTKLAAPNTMWGSGSRRVIKDWYLSKGVKQLAEIVTKNQSCHGWTHKDVIRMIHLKTDDTARSAVIHYILFGIKAAKDKYNDKPEAQEIINYIQTVEDVRHSTDEQTVARTVEQFKLTLEHLPVKFVKSKEVWRALLPHIPLTILLQNLQRMGYIGLLKPGAPFVNRVTDALTNEASIAESHLHPAQVFVTLRNYEVQSRFVAADNARKKQKTDAGVTEVAVEVDEKKAEKTPPKSNPKIVCALYDLFDATCKLLPPTGLKYLIAIDIKSFDATEKCYRTPHVTPAQAAVLVTLCLLKAEQCVNVIQPGPNGEVVALPLEKTMTIQQGIDKLQETKSEHKLNSPSPIEWALEQKKQFDVFLYITDGMFKGSNQIHSVLQKYREEMKLPNSKLITFLPKSSSQIVLAEISQDGNMLDIGGFDGNVCKIIEGFSRGAF